MSESESEPDEDEEALAHWGGSKLPDGRLFINIHSGVVHRGRQGDAGKTTCGCIVNDNFLAVQGSSLAQHEQYCKKCYRADLSMNDSDEEV